ncbi:UDP-4-amino-4,6-dideoxy-N-acetyl-beta-L-altrosamine transaminase [Aestuariivirga sp.]|jgi:UDP-4-amino-4,6-dideoxy-N-acetyl-beta-L-altrosamine transaminase|uniref:UDP-4-amino-4, 6-dideoxy-N-acetyl-beta-L-altrosamine transaminase n=1 Tax=Aestuariivirga sp. TaxID=2650926 RepID=UPI0037830BE3
MIPYGRQTITEADIDAVVKVLRSDFLTQGPAVPAFEQAVADRVGAAHAIAVNSATSALHIACLALGLGPGDQLWTSPITFVASANCAVYCGASVDFVDIDPLTYCMSPDALEEKLLVAAREGRLPKIIVPVHFAGQSCEMSRIGVLAKKYGICVIEDASHAIGASYHGKPVGDCRWSDICIFSFHPVKIVTTGEGGIATTQDAALAERMRMLRSHGITRDRDKMSRYDGSWYYEQIELGWNYRLTDIAAALGTSQMMQLDHYLSARRAHAAAYDAALVDLNVIRPHQHPDTLSSWHLYVIQVDPDQHRTIFQGLRKHGIGVNLHYIPVYRHPWYQRMGFNSDNFQSAESYYGRAISLPIFATLTENQRERVLAVLARETG